MKDNYLWFKVHISYTPTLWLFGPNLFRVIQICAYTCMFLKRDLPSKICTVLCEIESKKISNDQELIQSDPISCLIQSH